MTRESINQSAWQEVVVTCLCGPSWVTSKSAVTSSSEQDVTYKAMSLILEGLHADEWSDFPDFWGKKGVILVLDSET